MEADPEEGKHFVAMKARPVLQTEDDIEGVATVEAYQVRVARRQLPSSHPLDALRCGDRREPTRALHAHTRTAPHTRI